jgi:hypothetical protein
MANKHDAIAEITMTEPIEKNQMKLQPDEIERAEQDAIAPADEAGPEARTEEDEKIEEEPMIEVHAPHESVHSWKDVFIHIGIVTVGLLLAIGLEQTVEYFHHRHQVAETREALRVEREVNVVRFQAQTEEFNRFIPMLKTNLGIFVFLRQHPGAPPEKWPGRFHWLAQRISYTDSVWKTAQESNVLQYMPQVEVRNYSELYDNLKGLNELNSQADSTKREAYRYYILDADASHLTPQQLDHEIDQTTEALFLYSRCASAQNNMMRGNSDFQPTPAKDIMNQIFHNIFTPEERKQIQDEEVRSMNKEAALGGEGIVDESDKTK